jgi:hypothetical protein
MGWPRRYRLIVAFYYEGRDLQPTAALEAVITSAVAPHFDLTYQQRRCCLIS